VLSQARCLWSRGYGPIRTSDCVMRSNPGSTKHDRKEQGLEATRANPPPPPGWYANPSGPGQRYWDGHEWTDSYSQPMSGATTASTPAAKTGHVPMWVKVALGIIGALLIVLAAGCEQGYDRAHRTEVQARHIMRAHLPRKQLYASGVNRLSHLEWNCDRYKRSWRCDIIDEDAPIYGGEDRGIILSTRLRDNANQPSYYTVSSCPLAITGGTLLDCVDMGRYKSE
jgi:hypothetical protein